MTYGIRKKNKLIQQVINRVSHQIKKHSNAFFCRIIEPTITICIFIFFCKQTIKGMFIQQLIGRIFQRAVIPADVRWDSVVFRFVLFKTLPKLKLDNCPDQKGERQYHHKTLYANGVLKVNYRSQLWLLKHPERILNNLLAFIDFQKFTVCVAVNDITNLYDARLVMQVFMAKVDTPAFRLGVNLISDYFFARITRFTPPPMILDLDLFINGQAKV